MTTSFGRCLAGLISVVTCSAIYGILNGSCSCVTPDLHNSFPAVRTPKLVPALTLPVQVKIFVGRDAPRKVVQRLLTDDRMLMLTGEGGVGKSRLVIQVVAASGFLDDLIVF
ncbi:hypothetical protein ABFA25_03200 [Mycobacterium lepromatosis]|uniref:hypothetical protein n=1 Tax=Mycobacterium lepromatosis TaxID=480418 RepID=UPI0012E05468